ncbi:MAG TPA: hypothetical protein VLK65_10265 [Vicinamibacteria bacterium]|nr:hypothetical protein [Vicinamibacteria bacterium]
MMSFKTFAAMTIVCLLRNVAAAEEPTAEARAIRSLAWRSIGPANMGGRVSAILGVAGDPKTYWVAGADGGIWKTSNGGTTFEGQFENEAVYSVGAIALAPSDPNVLWLGSGEGDPRNSTSYGNGVYRSTDGGKNWSHLGLDDTERIKRIAVHPRDPDTAYVCALGHAWGDNEERGVFKTTDGGESWTKVLYIDADTGCSDVDMDLSNPRILYAGMWTHRRRPWRFDSGGEETALYKTTDGGKTWTKRTKGLPQGPMDRIGVQVAQSRPSIVYLITEAVDEGSLFRSDDFGESWKMVHDDARINFRPFYYSDIRVDPTNPEVVYSLSGGLFKSTDGGRTFDRIADDVHGDHQAFWIDPEDSDRLLSGSDGGFQVSFDGGKNWDIVNNVVLAQFYHIFFDDRDPYYVCGGLQDNGNWCGPSRTGNSAGILKDDWYSVSGGDGFYAVPIPGQPHLVYSNSQGGPINITDIRSGNTRRIHPYPVKTGSAGDAIVDHRYRFNWDAPIHISPHDPGTVYYGGNVVFKSTDYGYNWDVISPDLTTDDPDKQQSSGGEVVTDNTAAEFHCTIMTIAESPVEPGVIWAGTDDGNIQVTRDGGAGWTNVRDRIPGLPEFSWVQNIEASSHAGGTAYVVVDQHRMNDFRPHAFKTTDYGQTWSSLTAGLPQDDYAKVLREDPKNPKLLYLGMERGIQASWDGGQTWASIRNNLPPVSVRGIRLHPRENDLIIGTHGRGAFILDDVTPLQSLSAAMAQDADLFEIRPGVLWQSWGRGASLGQRTFVAENPPTGALINFYTKKAPEEPVTLVISDEKGNKVREWTVKDVDAGVHRVVWDLQHDGPTPLKSQPPPTGFFARFANQGPAAVPGNYTATVKIGGTELRKTVAVRTDPRIIDVTQSDYEKQLAAGLELRDLTSQVHRVIDTTAALHEQLENLENTLKDSGPDDAELAIEAVGTALQEVKDLEDRLQRPIPGLGYRQYPRIREELRSLARAISDAAARPTEPQMVRLEQLRQETAEVVNDLSRLLSTTIRDLNGSLGAYPKILVGKPATEPN